MTKRLLSMLLAIIIVVGILPVTGSALEPANVYSGSVPASNLKINDVILKDTVITGSFYLGWNDSKNDWTATNNYAVSRIDSGSYYFFNECFVITLVDPLDPSYSKTIYRLHGETFGSLPTLTRDGYSFGGWKYTSGGSVVSIAANNQPSKVFGRNYTVSLYAQWSENAADPTVAVESVSLDKTSATLTVGGTETLTATVTPSDATNKNVTWISSDATVATVDANGVVTAVGAGTATITVETEDGEFTDTCEVSVSAATVAVTGVALDKETLELTVGGTGTLTASVAPSNATNQKVTWASSDATVATVDETGKVTAVGAGTATITVTTEDGSKTDTCEVTVTAATVAVTGVALDKETLELTVGDEPVQLTASVAPSDATNQKVTWTSSDATVATVDETGKVTAVGTGTATITVETEDGKFTDTCTVTVVEEYDVWVGGVQITSANKDNLIKAINDANNGTVASGGISYDPDSKTLTLDNFSCSSDAFGGVINIQDGDITIKLKGNNTLTGTGKYPYGIYTTGNLVICNGEDGAAQGQLTINTKNYCINAYSGTLEINGVKVVATSTGGAGLSAESISLSGVTLSAIGGGDMYVIGESISVENSTVEAYCASDSPFSSTFRSAPTITGDYAVYAGENAGNADKVDAPTNETYTQSKYVRIEPANTVKKYTVTYKADGKVVKIVEVEHGKDATAPEIPAKTGYTAAWSADGKNITADTVINAVYTINQYTITFNTDGGSEIAAITQDYGTAVTAPANPTKTGYTFAGWEPALPETMPAEDMTVKAKWTPYQLTFRFDANGGMGTMENLVISYGETKNLTANAYTRDGYTFAGWTTESDGSGDFYANQAEVLMDKEENATITLWAKWSKNQTAVTYYVVSFDANGGSGTMTSVDVQANTVLTLPANGFKAPSGKTFKCWNINGTEYAAGKDVIITADTTVKAMWKNQSSADLDYVPAAGDNFPIFLWTCLVFSSVLALFFLLVLSKKYAKK